METVVLASTVPRKIVPDEDEVEDTNLEDNGDVEINDEHNEDKEIEETGNTEEDQEEKPQISDGGQLKNDVDKKKKEIVFDNDEIIKKAFQGDKDFLSEYSFANHLATCHHK